MVGVVGDHRCDQGAGVEDQRNGRGSNSSRLARALRSLRPALNAPINENGGCGASSPSSCSSAVLTSWGTATPRSWAAFSARSKSFGSTSTVFPGVAAMPGFYRRRSRQSAARGDQGIARQQNPGRTGAFTGALAGCAGGETVRSATANAPHLALASLPQQKTPRRGGEAFLGLLQGGEICISIYVDQWEVGGPLCAAGRVDGSQLPYERRRARPRSLCALIDPLSRILECRVRTYVRFVCEASHRARRVGAPSDSRRLFYPILRSG